MAMTQFERALIEQLKAMQKELHALNKKYKCSGSCTGGEIDKTVDSEVDK
jgi:hypothetical protein|nr:MAG TPA: protein of unknown function (DUF5320) [Caudoviricetes sp.]